MWNVDSTIDVFMLYILLALSLLIAASGIFRRYEIWSQGKGNWIRNTSILQMTRNFFSNALLQKKVVRNPEAGLFHTLIYIGFLVLLFTTTMVFIDHDLGIKIYNGDFYLLVTIISDIFGFGLLVGVAIAWERRKNKPNHPIHTTKIDFNILTVLAILTIQGFLLEGIRIHATEDPWAAYSPIGYLTSTIFWPFSLSSIRNIHYFVWWSHTLTVYAVIALVPYTKFFHILTSSLNLFLQDTQRPVGRMSSIGDIEKLIETEDEFSLGLGTIKDYSIKQLIELDSCTSCGRCQDACPAYIAEKPLSPKWVVLDSRNHMLGLSADGKFKESMLPDFMLKLDSWLTGNLLLKNSGLQKKSEGGFDATGDYRGLNNSIWSSTKVVGNNIETPLPKGVISDETLWSCTSCMACVQACPVGISPMDFILEGRRYLTLMEGSIPSEAQPTLRSLETRTNPYGDPNDRSNWAQNEGDDGIQFLQSGDSVDFLYWVGCVSSFDKRKQSIARSLCKIMKSAGLSFGILGNLEGCTGDPARRLGEENLFQQLAKKNIGTLKSVEFNTLVTNCPHCMNSLKNEYPEFGEISNDDSKIEIIHHTTLISRLIDDGKISLKDSPEAKNVTFHDPCYLGRYNNEFDAPRKSLKSVKGLKVLEMDRNREQGLCCGAGGGHFWMDIKQGKRINTIRVDEAAQTGADTIATGCPFCMQMLEDSVKMTEREEILEVKDVAEIVSSNLKA